MGSTADMPILIGITIIFLAVLYRFVALLITTLKNSKCTLKETATIIKIEEKKVSFKKLKQSMNTTVYIPIYEYQVNNTTYTYKGPQEEVSLKKVGDEEFVFYDPLKPARIISKKNDLSKIIISFMIWILVGLSFILYGILLSL